jgi:hypothetical protein
MRVVVVVGFSYFAGDMLLMAMLGSGAILGPVLEVVMPAAIYIMAVAISLLGLAACFNGLEKAIKSRNVHWAIDAFLAPAVAIVAVFWVFQGMHFWYDFVHFMIELGRQQTLADIAVGGCLALLWWICAFGGPFMAVSCMSSEKGSVRLMSYGGFIVTAFTWGLFLLFLTGGVIKT